MDHLRDSRSMSVEEQLEILLYTIGDIQRNRIMQNLSQHLGENLKRYINVTLNAIFKLAPYYIKQSERGCPPHIANDPLFYLFIKVIV